MKNNTLHNNQDAGFKVPENYFSNIEEQIMGSINLKSKITESGFKTPESYFKNLEQEITQKLSSKNQEPKVVTLFSKRTLLAVSGIAASLLLIITLTFKTSGAISFSEINDDLLSDYIINQTSENELTAMFSTDELSQIQFTDYSFSDETLDSMLETIDLEDLITE